MVDFGNSRVQKFSANREFLAKWGSKGPGDAQFYFPLGIAVDGSGHVYVTDSYNGREQVFSVQVQRPQGFSLCLKRCLASLFRLTDLLEVPFWQIAL